MFAKKKPDRPYLKICTSCHGKGQLSHFNNAQDKKYASCTKCTTGNSPVGGLGVTLKCACQPVSARYESVRASDMQYIKGLDTKVAKGLKAYQEELGSEAVAVCLMCDCGAKYLVADVGQRRRIRGDKEGEENEEDKEHNKCIAQALATRGVTRVLVPPPPAAAAP